MENENNNKKTNTEKILNLNVELSELYAKTEVIQFYENETNHPLELKVNIPLINEIIVSSFEAKIDDKIIKSKIMEKEKAKEKYNDVIVNQDSAFYGSYTDTEIGKNFFVSLGNIKPGVKIEFKTYFYQFIEQSNLSYNYCMMTKFPKFNLFEIEEDKKEEKDEFSEKAEKKITISYMNVNAKIHLKTHSSIVNLTDQNTYSKIKFKKEFNDDFTECNIIYEKENMDDFINTPLQLYFSTIDMNIPKLYIQFDETNDETACVLNFFLNEKENLKLEDLMKTTEKINKEKNNLKMPSEINNINLIDQYFKENELIEHPGLFIFLIDQSGSMSGRPIKLVQDSLNLLIQSLPKNSYYQLIGFGSEFIKYDKIPKEYNKNNIQSTKDFISTLEAKLGGTNIFDPLKEIYNDNYYNSIKLPKYIILLTDGEVENKDEVLNLILQHNSQFNVHSIGLGKYFSKDLIKGVGINGKGSFHFCEKLEDLNKTIIETLNHCMLSIYTCKFVLKNDNLNVIKTFENDDNYFLQFSKLSFSFLFKGQLKDDENIEIEFENKTNEQLNKIDLKFYSSKDKIFSFYKLPQGNELAKILYGRLLKNNKNISINEEIQYAKKYEIVTNNTALFAKFENEDNKNTESMETISSENKSNWKSEFIKKNIVYKRNKRDEDEIYLPNLNYSYNYKSAKKKASPFSFGEINIFSKIGSSIGGAFKKLFKKKNTREVYSSSPIDFISTKENLENDFKIKSIENEINDINSESKIETKIETIENKKNNIKIKDLILSQDPIDGYWEKNDSFKIIQNSINEDYEKCYEFIINKKKLEENIFYTFIMIYYIIKKENEKLFEYSKIIEKGKKFLIDKNYSYDNLFTEIFN